MISAEIPEALVSIKGRRVTLIGVGNSLRGDDGFGPALVQALRVYEPRLGWTLIDAGTAPENFTATVRRSEPEIIVIADCGELRADPGFVRIAKADDLAGGGLSTHTPSLALIAGIWRDDLGAEVYVLAIQPKQVAFGEGLSPAVQEGVKVLVEAIVRAAGEQDGTAE